LDRKNGLADSKSARPFSMDRAVATGKHLQTTCGTHNKRLNAPVIKLLSKGKKKSRKAA